MEKGARYTFVRDAEGDALGRNKNVAKPIDVFQRNSTRPGARSRIKKKPGGLGNSQNLSKTTAHGDSRNFGSPERVDWRQLDL
jgi:hypothetical protein